MTGRRGPTGDEEQLTIARLRMSGKGTWTLGPLFRRSRIEIGILREPLLEKLLAQEGSDPS